jgi:hypothetical protein
VSRCAGHCGPGKGALVASRKNPKRCRATLATALQGRALWLRNRIGQWTVLWLGVGRIQSGVALRFATATQGRALWFVNRLVGSRKNPKRCRATLATALQGKGALVVNSDRSVDGTLVGSRKNPKRCRAALATALQGRVLGFVNRLVGSRKNPKRCRAALCHRTPRKGACHRSPRKGTLPPYASTALQRSSHERFGRQI